MVTPYNINNREITSADVGNAIGNTFCVTCASFLCYLFMINKHSFSPSVSRQRLRSFEYVTFVIRAYDNRIIEFRKSVIVGRNNPYENHAFFNYLNCMHSGGRGLEINAQISTSKCIPRPRHCLQLLLASG